MRLQYLDLHGCSEITDAGLRVLSGMPLQHLKLGNLFQITDAGLQVLSGMSLLGLDLSRTNITDAGLALLKGIRLQYLNLRDCTQITDSGLEFLSGIPLQDLNLRETNITNNGLRYLEKMPVTKLNLSRSKVTSEALLNVNTLQWLNLYGCGITIIKICSQNLVELDVGGCEKLQEIEGDFISLRYLNLSGCVSLKSLNFLERAVHLQTLDASRCFSLIGLNALAEKKSLIKLNLMDCIKVSDSHVSLLQKAPSLQSLNLSNTLVTGESLNFLGTNLKSISLSSCPFLRVLPSLPPCLKYLNLRRCSVLKNKKFKYLFKLPQLKQLEIEVSSNRGELVYLLRNHPQKILGEYYLHKLEKVVQKGFKDEDEYTSDDDSD
jgi:uncharacterized protein YjbI with pentapeptide repeats